MENSQKFSKHENADKENKSIDVQKVIADDIDEGAWYVCNKVWNLLDCPVNESNDLSLNERLADIQVNHLPFFLHSFLILNKIENLKTISYDQKSNFLFRDKIAFTSIYNAS